MSVTITGGSRSQGNGLVQQRNSLCGWGKGQHILELASKNQGPDAKYWRQIICYEPEKQKYMKPHVWQTQVISVIVFPSECLPFLILQVLFCILEGI